jgi:LEA14-like dessication related protein
MKKYFVILFLLCCAVIFSCANMKDLTFSGIENITIVNLSGKSVEAIITVRIKNPNSISFTIYKSEMDVTLSGIDAGKACITDNVKINAKSEEAYTFKVKSDFSHVSIVDIPKIISMALSKNVKIGLKGNLKAGKLFFKRTYPIDILQNVPLSGM